jgi:aminomethyltransferase
VAQTLLRTPLYDRHVALGARLVPFAGWEMPVQYEGVIPEHRAVRRDAGAFDVSHMGEIDVEGTSFCRACSRTTSTASRTGTRNTRCSRTSAAGSSTT